MKYFILFSLLFLSAAHANTDKIIKKVKVLEIRSTINPATFNYLNTNFKKLDKGDVVVIKMNTPGGLVSTTKEILTLFGQTEAPVIVWVTPSGASATSAGAIISAGADYLYMNEGTNIGAATPVQMGKKIEGDMRNKAVNDIVALVKSLSESKQRNAQAFSEMVEKASSFSAQEAEQKKIINAMTKSLPAILQDLQKRGFILSDDLITQEIPMSFAQTLLDFFANPMLAYILFIMGAALLYFELQAPGGFISGAVGVALLVLSGIGFQVLPINIGGIGLILASFIMFVLEAYITSYGILSLIGIITLFIGSTILYDGHDGFVIWEGTAVYSVISAIILFMAFISFYFMRTHLGLKKLLHGRKDMFFGFEGETGTVLSKDGDNEYQVKIHGEIWKATGPANLVVGDTIKTLDKDEQNLILHITKE